MSTTIDINTWGQTITITTGFDLTGYTELRLIIRNPDLTTDEITAGVTSATPTTGIVTYVVPETLGVDGPILWDQDGTYEGTLRASFSDARHEQETPFTVLVKRTNQSR